MTDAALVGAVVAPDLHVMTYNIRRRLPTLRPDSPDRWDNRKPLLRRLLAAEQPTLLGAQEALADQVEVVAAALGPAYRWVGYGRQKAGRDERNPIIYDSRRLELTGWRQWALSATPEAPGSRSWGNLVRRVLVSADFTDIATGGRVLAFNTHFDHISWRSRLRSATFLLDRVRLAHAAEPEAMIVVTGDFNAGADSAVHRRLTAEGALRDAWTAAAEQLTPQWGTLSHYKPRHRGGKRIDFVLVGPDVDVRSAGINAARYDGRAASDHEPVQAVVRPAPSPPPGRSG
ncbi:endonuclease/exonuclease/phosphatase family protein [Cryobacterium sp.]|jgi:endonuclease/exonuclease/phosphatase family metal-dependent hydrolase|uniref:endonuclease/exonuclease/phosphatase family protein n=1 Tax=Cryobacterium sp. TaxID=1926290 RepID=UPI00262173CB|nr:endonuclease/exonuclease/phosphatase family protein [Cryobacterium sp.]MCU1445799.1 hydrolase [Cryobacterium sp.]